jgi:hypothetical protein
MERLLVLLSRQSRKPLDAVLKKLSKRMPRSRKISQSRRITSWV